MKPKILDKSKLNLSIDLIMLLLMLPIAGIGFLIKYVLVSGIQRNERYGNNVDLEFYGLTRHQWGTIHLVLSIVFLGLLVLHLVLHWKMIVCIFKKMIPNRILRVIFVSVIVSSGLLMIAFPLFVKPEITERIPLHRNMKNVATTDTSVLNELSPAIAPKELSPEKHQMQSEEHNLVEEYEINGSMTLQFIAEKYKISAEQIAADLNIPETYIGEKLGRLKKHYSFTMGDVRNSIHKLKTDNKD